MRKCSGRSLLLLMATIVFFLSFCDIELTRAPKGPSTRTTTGIRMTATGKSVVLGSSTAVVPDEKPSMTVAFNHDFTIDSTEVTISMYNSVMGTLPAEYDDRNVDPLEPVGFVSWFDAILFCNKRSALEGLDSVYYFTGAEGTIGGGVYRLAGLSINPGADGYRLPTEAEWVFAARAGGGSVYPWPGDNSESAQEYAWYTANANETSHPVATKAHNGTGIYDMAGNVAEWVFDVKSSYRDTMITEFLGAPIGTTDERIIKGGGFVNDQTYLRIDNRGDTYSVTSATRASHVGFRCVKGSIEGGTYLRDSSTVIAVEPVEILLQNAASAVGTNRASVAFVNMVENKRYLNILDYSSSTPILRQWTDIDNVHMPMISPNGKWVAYATAGSGRVTGSEIRIRAANGEKDIAALPDAFAPRFWVAPNGTDTFVVYTSSMVSNETSQWPSTSTYRVRFSGGVFAGAPELITDKGSYHGGLSGDGRYCATGFTRLMIRDLDAATNRVLFTGPANGKEDGDTSQVCNVSIAPDNSGSVLFLDFGSNSVSTLTGSRYGVHEYLFISSANNRVQRWYQAPAGYQGWSHPEWSNNSSYAISNASVSSGKNPRLFIIDLDDSTYVPVVAGDNLVDPSLWIETKSNVHLPVDSYDLDSLGWYNEPPAEKFQDGIAAKFPYFWRALDSVEVMFLGNSRIQAGINPEWISYPSFNMGHGGGGHMEVRNLIYGYVLPHGKKVRAVVMSLSVDWFAGPHVKGNGSRSWLDGIENTRGYNYDRNHNFWKQGINDTFVTLIEKAPHPELGEDTYESGWHKHEPKYVDKVFGVMNCTTWTTSEPSCQNSLDSLKLMGNELAARGIHLFIVNFPQSSLYSDRSALWTRGKIYGRYGPSWRVAHELVDSVNAMADRNNHVHFYDAYKFGNHDYSNATDFRDVDHLSKNGAEKISTRVDSIITEILK